MKIELQCKGKQKPDYHGNQHTREIFHNFSNPYLQFPQIFSNISKLNFDKIKISIVENWIANRNLMTMGYRLAISRRISLNRRRGTRENNARLRSCVRHKRIFCSLTESLELSRRGTAYHRCLTRIPRPDANEFETWS